MLDACELVRLSPGEELAEAGQLLDVVHFVESGFLSVIASDGESGQVEIGLIGREGMCGVPVALGCPVMPFRVIAQSEGAAYRMSAGAFRKLGSDVPALNRLVLMYSQVFTTQIAETSRANARHTIESRLARWFLMAHDRSESDEIAITHEMLSQVLGIRRPGVTVSIHVLEGEGMIKARRGSIKVLDRAKLSAAANGSYGRSEAEYRRIFSAQEGDAVATRRSGWRTTVPAHLDINGEQGVIRALLRPQRAASNRPITLSDRDF